MVFYDFTVLHLQYLSLIMRLQYFIGTYELR